jgi:hypothetical protein
MTGPARRRRLENALAARIRGVLVAQELGVLLRVGLVIDRHHRGDRAGGIGKRAPRGNLWE